MRLWVRLVLLLRGAGSLMDLEEYERLKRAKYAAFAETVASILTAAIRREPNSRLQQVQHRAKDPVSLNKEA
jgi:hypothetical protein